MKLDKKGQASIGNKVTGIILGVVSVVVLVSMAPTLWTQLDTALSNENLTSVPFLGTMGGILGLIFGVVIFIGALYAMFKLMSNQR